MTRGYGDADTTVRPLGYGLRGALGPRRLATLCILIAVVPVASGCSGGGSGTHGRTVTPASQSGAVATRWWSDGAAPAGSTVDAAHPSAAAAKLHPSRPQYCTMLRQTVRAGRSVLPGVTAKDPALVATTRAFVAEVRGVAPGEVKAPWGVLGPAVIALVESGGDTSRVTGIDTAAVQRAAVAIAADSRSRCGVDLSATAKRATS